ncbi:MAG: penicillin-binding protein 2 [Vulcanimicrobiota bacterium]
MKPARTFKARIRQFGLAGTLFLTVLGARLYELQVVKGSEYLEKAHRNTVVVEARPAARGRILDCRGEILVSNAPQFELVVTPSELRDRKEVIKELSRLLDETEPELEKKIRAAAPHAPLVLQRDLTQDTLARGTEIAEYRKGVGVRAGAIRRFKYGKMASHLFGYVGEINAEELRTRRDLGYAMGDGIGKVGLEKQYDTLLRGRKGADQIHIDVLGRTVSQTELRPSTPGPDLYLHLDAQLQQVAEKALGETLVELWKQNGERSGGTVVVMEVKTGAVKALASLPQYDPVPFARGIKYKEYQALLDDPGFPLVNRMIHSAFSPGSTFKLVTATAALQGGLCTTASYFVCGGSFGPANCFVRSGHGGISFEDSMAHSCDVVYYKLGFEMGIAHLRKWCALYGLGSPTGIDLPAETGGLLPSPEWKLREWEDRWYDGDTINMSIGQGFLLVSPLQMAVVTAAVANGGYVVRPTLAMKAVAKNGAVLLEPEPARTQLPAKPEFLASVRRGMRGAVLHGTAVATNLPQVQVAGKTGTVENSPSIHNKHGRNHVWFVSFAPYDDPEVTVVVFLEKSHGYGGGLAAPIARQVYEKLYPQGWEKERKEAKPHA